MSMGICGAFRLFVRMTPHSNAMELNRMWAKRGQMAGLVAGACSFVLRDWRVQFVSLACFVSATVLDDVHKVNSLHKAESVGSKTEQEDAHAIVYLKEAAVKADTIFLRYFPDSVWARVQSYGLIQTPKG